MAGKHLKRLAAPRALHVHRKEAVWTFKTNAGPHPHHRSVPLANLVRDYFGFADTGREARRLIGAGNVLVDGNAQKDHKFPVGLMDVVSIPAMKKAWRIVADRHGRLQAVDTKPEEARWKLSRIQNKTTIRGGKTQLNLHDGRCLIVPKDEYKTGDVLKLEVPGQKVMGVHRFKEGTLGFVVAGAHAGQVAPIKAIEVKRGSTANWVVMTGEGGNEFRTIRDYVFPVGDKKSEITLPEASALGQ